MTEKPLVSVIINCYNSEKYLRETIDSLVAQTYENWEAIFWDNCSTDKTAEIITSYKEARFRYFLAEKNTPLGEARNLAMEKIQGKYFCFLDSDDVWAEDFLFKAVTVLLQDIKIVCFFSNYYDWKGNRKKAHNKNCISGERTFKDMVRNYGVGMSSALLRSNVAKQNDIHFNSNYQLVEDLDFFLKMSRKGLFYYEATPLNLYRIHPNSYSFKQLEGWEEEYNHVYNELKKIYISGGGNLLEEKDIKWIRNRAIACRLEFLMMQNRKRELLRTLLFEKELPIRYWSRIFFVLLGKGLFVKMKAIKERLL